MQKSIIKNTGLQSYFFLSITEEKQTLFIDVYINPTLPYLT